MLPVNPDDSKAEVKPAKGGKPALSVVGKAPKTGPDDELSAEPPEVALDDVSEEVVEETRHVVSLREAMEKPINTTMISFTNKLAFKNKSITI